MKIISLHVAPIMKLLESMKVAESDNLRTGVSMGWGGSENIWIVKYEHEQIPSSSSFSLS